MVGAIDVATHSIETPQEVADTLRQALNYVDADKLYPCTNCGMAPLPRHIAREKTTGTDSRCGDSPEGVSWLILVLVTGSCFSEVALPTGVK